MILAFGYCMFFRNVALALVVSATLLFGHAHAQTSPPEKAEKNKPDKTKAVQPLELPEFVITGVESLDVPGGAKQVPKPVPKLTLQQISHFNPLDKQPFTLLPAAPISPTLLAQQEKNGFVQGEFGMFITPSVEAGYRAVFGNFDLNANAGIVLSNGYRPNTDFTDIHADIESSYLAPEKFFFFGGSRTETRIRVRNRNYKFFGADSTAFPESAPQRNVLNLEAGVQTVGNFEGWQYDMGASVESALLSSVHENTLVNGHIAAKTSLGAFSLGGKADVQLQGVIVRPFAERYWLAPSILAGYNVSDFSLSAEVGVHTVSTGFVNILRPSANLKAAFAASSLLTLELSALTGIRPNSFLRALGQNPYTLSISGGAAANDIYYFETVLYDFSVLMRFHPSQYIGLTVGSELENCDFAMVYGRTNRDGGFAPEYRLTNIVRLFAELDGNITASDNIKARLNARFGGSRVVGIAQNQGTDVPYLSPFDASLQYRRQWLSQLHSIVEGVYVSEQSPGTGKNLPAYFDLRLKAEYQITNAISVYARGTNLLNQSIFLWQGYQERGIFIAAGFVMTF
jgi:hypothetical protein